MTESVYKVIELIGTSKDSWEKAAAAAVNRAGASLRNLRVEGGVNGAFVLVRTNGTVGDATLERVQKLDVGTGHALRRHTSDA